jgi:hypothetical protein
MGKHKHKAKNVIQEHHLEYQRKDKTIEKTGETVLIYKGEHWAITQLQRRKNISKGFIRALEFWIEKNKEEGLEDLKVGRVREVNNSWKTLSEKMVKRDNNKRRNKKNGKTKHMA